MLNKAERFEVLKMIRRWCKFGWLPAEVDLSKWEILPHAKRLTTWKCFLWFFLFALHAFYKLVALGYWLKVGIPLYEAVLHAVLACTVPVIIYWYYIMYIKYPRLFGVYFNMTLTGNYGDEATAVNSQNVRPWSRRLKECTLQDVFAMTLSYTTPLACMAMMLTFIRKPSMKYLLYAALPKEHQTWVTFGILFFLECRHITTACSITVPTWIVQVISFDLVRNKLRLLIDSMQRTGRLQRSRNMYKSLRCIQLYVGITNYINCYIIFSFKLLVLGVSIGTGYAAVAHFSAYPVFGVMYYLTFLNAASIYIFCYDKAFKIPDLFQRVTQRAMLVTCRKNTQVSKIFKRQMRSFPRTGIKVGEFHLMERESTLNFIDFVLNNIVSLLVAC